MMTDVSNKIENARARASYLTGLVPQGNCGEDVAKIAACHPNLRFKNGYGMASACAIDDDSKMRFGATQTNPRHRQQLQTRVYHGHAHYEKGCLAPDIESDLIHTEGTRTSRPWRAIRYRDRSLRTTHSVYLRGRPGSSTHSERDQVRIHEHGYVTRITSRNVASRWTRMETLKFTFLREKIDCLKIDAPVTDTTVTHERQNQDYSEPAYTVHVP
jgi:hypothetical protein